jgi:hypothetical protein
LQAAWTATALATQRSLDFHHSSMQVVEYLDRKRSNWATAYASAHVRVLGSKVHLLTERVHDIIFVVGFKPYYRFENFDSLLDNELVDYR